MKSNSSELAYFSKIDWSAYSGAVVFLDIDGTLVADSECELSADTAQALRVLAQKNTVVITSNGSNRFRAEQLARQFGIEVSPRGIKKPDPAIAVPFVGTGTRLVVVGDKNVVDGAFARAIGAEFVRVTRVVSGSERISVRLSYVVDDYAWVSFVFVALRLARPRQWIKNLLICAPAFFAVTLTHASSFVSLMASVVSFSAIASAVYAANDARDAKADAMHPIKRARPVASGALSAVVAYVLAAVWVLIGVVAAWWLAPTLIPYLIGYVIANIFYTLYLKRIPVAETIVVAAFYIVRILAGGAVADVPVSDWLILCAFFLASFLVVAKRRAEAKREGTTRGVLSAYPAGFLDAAIGITATTSIVSYALYSVLAAAHPAMVYSNAFVVFAVLRYLFISWEGHGAERPERLLMRDAPIVTSVFLWFAFVSVLYYAF
jgi:4-hydroxybenzoate polyprenyltransferase/predicted HAD superfamily phosphohydrolase YqeG